MCGKVFELLPSSHQNDGYFYSTIDRFQLRLSPTPNKCHNQADNWKFPHLKSLPIKIKSTFNCSRNVSGWIEAIKNYQNRPHFTTNLRLYTKPHPKKPSKCLSTLTFEILRNIKFNDLSIFINISFFIFIFRLKLIKQRWNIILKTSENHKKSIRGFLRLLF